jgi:hypothetical protein
VLDGPVASASSDHFLKTESLVLPAVIFACEQESGEYKYGQICQMEGEGELCTCLCVWSKGGLELCMRLCAWSKAGLELFFLWLHI